MNHTSNGIIITVSLFGLLFGGCGRKTATQPVASPRNQPLAAHGWIRVTSGSPEQIKRAIIEHTERTKSVKPQVFRIVILKQPSGFSAVTFPDGITPWDFVNLVGWLNHPPNNTGVSGATGWIASPGTGLRYSLAPESGTRFGDTLIGVSSDGNSVQVYLPDATMCVLSRRVQAIPEPTLSETAAQKAEMFTVTLDVDPSFGNPDFKITHPKDNDWNK